MAYEPSINALTALKSVFVVRRKNRGDGQRYYAELSPCYGSECD